MRKESHVGTRRGDMADGCLNCQELELQLRTARLNQPASLPEQRRMQRIDTLGQLAAAITHEYNNTIGVILHSTAMLKDEDEPVGDAHAHIERIHRAATRAREFTRQLATFGRVRSLRRAPLDCDGILGDLYATIEQQCQTANIALDASLATGAARVLADRNQFEMLVHSLVANARDAMPEGGVLRLATQVVQVDAAAATVLGGATAGAYLTLMVADTGTGVSADALDHMFEPFFSTKPRAMGLGLAAVYAIAKTSGGFVCVENGANSGACFTVYLPVMMSEETRSA